MSQKECPACHYIFLKKKDFIDHITYSSCAETVNGVLVLCPHCKKQFPDEDSLSYHLLRNEACSKQQDKACDLLNRLPRHDDRFLYASKRHKSLSSQEEQDDCFKPQGDEAYHNVNDTFHIEQGIIVNNQVLLDNQHGSGYKRSNGTTFISLDEIQHGDNRPYFQIETFHHTQAWRQISSFDKSGLMEKDKGLMCYQQHLKHASPATGWTEETEGNHGEATTVAERDHIDDSAQDFEIHLDDSDSVSGNISTQFNDNDESDESERDEDIWAGTVQSVMMDTKAIHHHHARLLLSNETIALTDLYAMLNRRGIPAHLFDALSLWAWKNRKLLSTMNEPPVKRVKYLKTIRKTVRGTDAAVDEFKPKRMLIELSSGKQVFITTIGFQNMIKDMLSNTTLMRPDNILFDHPNDNTLSEVNTGQWWSVSTAMECNAESDLLWPLIMFIDGMKISNLGSLRLEPVTFTFARFKRHIRNQNNAWRTAAFIEEVHQKRAYNDLSAAEKLQDYHDILRFIFSELSVLQSKGIAWQFPDQYGELSNRKVVLKLPIQLIIGDCEGHDKLCGRYKSHTQKVKGLCRDCDVPTKYADNVDWRCSYRTASELRTKTAEELADFSFYHINNALHSLSFGSTFRGFIGALLAENLHVLKSGLFPVIFEGIWSSLSQKGKDYLQCASQFFVHINKSVDKFHGMPPINAYRNGLTSESTGGAMSLDASEKHGRVFLLYCLLTCSPVLLYLCRHQKRDSDYNLEYWKQIIKILEMALSFEAWVCRKEHQRPDIIGEDGTPETSNAHMRIRQFLHKLRTFCPTMTSAEFRTTKFHQCLHFPRYIHEHGSMLNFDGNRPESMAKKNLKDPASHTQGRHNTLTYQTAVKYLDQLTVLDAQRIISEQSQTPVEWSEPFNYINFDSDSHCHDDTDSDDDETWNGTMHCTGTKFQVSYSYDNDYDQHNVQLTWKTKGAIPVQGFDNSILQYISDRLFNSRDGGRIGEDNVNGFTKLKMPNGIPYNAHPYARNDRPRHDWVFIRWSKFDDPVPARIEMFLDLRESTIKFDNRHLVHPDALEEGENDIPLYHANKVLLQSVYAIVWSASSNKCNRNDLTRYHINTSLCYRVKMEPFKRLVEVSSFEQKCFAYINSVGCGALFDSTAIVFHQNADWPQIVLDGCHST